MLGVLSPLTLKAMLPHLLNFSTDPTQRATQLSNLYHLLHVALQTEAKLRPSQNQSQTPSQTADEATLGSFGTEQHAAAKQLATRIGVPEDIFHEASGQWQQNQQEASEQLRLNSFASDVSVVLDDLGVKHRVGVGLGPHNFCVDIALGDEVVALANHAVEQARQKGTKPSGMLLQQGSIQGVAVVLGHEGLCTVNGDPTPLGELILLNQMLFSKGVVSVLVPER